MSELELNFYISTIDQDFKVTPLGVVNSNYEEVDELNYGLLQEAKSQGHFIYKKEGEFKASEASKPNEEATFNIAAESWD
ncbi:hypothetical protein NCY62_14900 [Acinetobacter pittii]|uniref:Uncharacterized protein n=1 Tax=Acinetobacter pittii TaxID=48296 RepID=A0AAE9M7I1_ACIPI|nr:hypothetical protein [Acinetobacter pittii]AZP30614.1 hypothetical protein DLK06_16935 [Acinetobacter pittii]MCM1963362.1 hypothetical protein [Acinetobacter pittii]MCM1979772.1 hypothetical protein [Acinetobacter pittii]USU94010.1 hypothetical protein MWH18_16955 [Acinetobacter pittii]